MQNAVNAKKQYTAVWLNYASFLAVIYVSGQLIQKFTPVVEWTGNAAPWVMTILTTYVIGFPVLALLIKSTPAEAPQKNKVSFGWMLAFYVMTIAVSMLVSAVGKPVVSLLNRVTQSVAGSTLSSGGAESAISGASLVWLISVVVIIGPIFEELAFRKLLIDHIYKYGEGMAIVMSGIAFALFHESTSQFFYTAAMGMMLAYVYIRSGNVLYPMGIHIACNLISGLLMQKIDMNALTNAMSLPEEEQIAVMMPIMSILAILCVLWVAGIIVLIVWLKKKKFHLCEAPALLPKGEKKVAFMNLGFVVYFLIVMLIMMF